MTTNVYITAHGAWKPDYAGFGSIPKLPGFATVPQRCTVRFYVQNLKLMLESDVRSTLRGDITPDPESEFAENMYYPNMMATSIGKTRRATDRASFDQGVTSGKLAKPAIFYSPAGTNTLEKLINVIRLANGEDKKYIFHWLCCRSPGTPKSPAALKKFSKEGGSIGVGANEPLTGDESFMLFERSGSNRVNIGYIERNEQKDRGSHGKSPIFLYDKL